MKGTGCFLGAALFWSSLTLVFDGFMFYGAYWQTLAETWPTTTGIITKSEIKVDHSSDGATYRPDISFTYEVDGQTYTSDTHRFDQMGTNDRSEPRRIVRDFPTGSSATVWYNPSKPDQAVLSPGVGTMTYFMAVFLAPFNVVMFFLWYAFLEGAWRDLFHPAAGGVMIIRSGGRIRARLATVPALLVFGIGFGATCFVSIFVLAFSGMMYWKEACLTVLVIAALVGTVAMIYELKKRFSGAYDLIIDRPQGSLWLPKNAKDGPERIDLFNLQRVSVTTTDSDGDKTTQYCPTVWWLDEAQQQQSAKIVEWSNDRVAKQFTQWLAKTLGLPETTEPEEPSY